MKPKTFSSIITPILIILSLVLAQLACSTLSPKTQASPLPPSATQPRLTQVQPTQAQPLSPKATDTQAPTIGPKPTNTPRPTVMLPSATPTPQPITVFSQGFGQNQQQLGYAFIIENPNQEIAIQNSHYQVAAYDANEAVVETDFGILDLILPGQKLGIGGSIYLNEGITVAKIEVQFSAGEAVITDLTAAFTTDKVVYSYDEYTSKVMGMVTNPFDRDLTDLKVYAVLYNDAGEIVGGGYSYLGFILAQGTTGVSLYVNGAGKVTRAELYPTISWFSSLTSSEETPEGAQNLTIIKQGYSLIENEVGYGIIFENPNTAYAVESSRYHINLFDKDGNIVYVEEGYLQTLLPSQTLGLGGAIYLNQGLTVSSADFQIKTGSFEASDPLPGFTADNISFLDDPYWPKVTGEIISPFSKDISNVRVSAIVYNEAGDIIGGGNAYVDFVPANGKAAVEVGITAAGKPATIELYAAVSTLSEYK